MKKFLLAVVGAVMLLIIPSAYYPTDSIVGEVAPNFEVSNDNKAVEIDKLRGRYILLSFWSSTDPKSRLANKAYNDIMTGEKNMVEYVAVNFDPSSKVFEEIVKIDDLNADNQFHINGSSMPVVGEDYGLHGNFVSFLIAPDGEIIAQNPSANDVKALLKA